MNTEILGVIAAFALTVLLGALLGKYMSKVFKGEKVWSDFMLPLENLIFKISGINPNQPMDWKQNMKAMLKLNFVFFLWTIILLMVQNLLFWNPVGIAGMEPTLAFNTAASFVTNTNLQHYSGETGASYFTQLALLGFLQFVSAATGIAAAALLFKGLIQKQKKDLGNFYNLFLKSCTRILLPISFVVAVILLLNGSPESFEGLQKTVTLEGDTVNVATGPVASMVAIKHAGTNGGGFFGPNSAHPFENPNYLTNTAEVVSQLLIAVGLVFAFGYYSGRKKLSYIIMGVMTFIFVIFVSLAFNWETAGNPLIQKMGIDISQGNMEGKEARFGAAASAYFGIATTSTSTGAVISMHDSWMPLAGGLLLIDMMVNSIFGGVGVGFLNFFVYLIIGVFIAGLMVGRTPEFMGKKIEAREIKIAAIVTLLHPFLILVGTGIAAYAAASVPAIDWVNNASYHGFSEMLYEFTSASANNGSGFEGLKDNTYFWNISTGIVMLIARYIPMIGPVAIAGFMAEKKYIPESAGTLRIDSLTFSVVLIAVLAIVAALSFFPALSLGPIAEYLTMNY
jgi:K+-transporting ATPase ATPase A chain